MRQVWPGLSVQTEQKTQTSALSPVHPEQTAANPIAAAVIGTLM
jgi:hypothetical protein